jgi:hypothetical protein
MARRPKPQAKSVPEFIRKQKPKYRTIMLRVRRSVRRAAPRLSEQLKWGWPSYLRDKKFVCFIYVIGGHVNLGFRQGKYLKDPERFLRGTGKAMRHMKFRKPADVNSRVISRFVRQAYALAS